MGSPWGHGQGRFLSSRNTRHGLAQVVGMGLAEALELPIRNATTVIKAMRFMFDKWPRLVAEYAS